MEITMVFSLVGIATIVACIIRHWERMEPKYQAFVKCCRELFWANSEKERQSAVVECQNCLDKYIIYMPEEFRDMISKVIWNSETMSTDIKASADQRREYVKYIEAPHLYLSHLTFWSTILLKISYKCNKTK